MSKKKVVFFVFILLSFSLLAEEDDIQKKNRDTIRYGTDAEIIDLIASLKEIDDKSLDRDFLFVLQESPPSRITEAIVDYFIKNLGEYKKEEVPLLYTEVDSYILEIIKYWDQYAETLVEHALDYIGERRLEEGLPHVLELLKGEHTRFLDKAIRSLGKIGGEAGTVALIDWFNDSERELRYKQAVYRALAIAPHSRATEFIKTELADTMASASTKIALLQVAASLKDKDLLDDMLLLINDKDPQVRATLIESLGGYSGNQVEEAILLGFRDSFYKTRIAATKAAGSGNLASAIPYLIYRAERDTVPNVQLAAIEALSAYPQEEVGTFLASLLKDDKKGPKIRAYSARALLKIDGEEYISLLIEVMETAVQGKKQLPLYHELARLIVAEKFSGAEELAKKLFHSPELTDHHYALDLVRKNHITSLKDEVEKLNTGKSGSLARKAHLVFELLDEGEKD